jgi:hypothetical protein
MDQSPPAAAPSSKTALIVALIFGALFVVAYVLVIKAYQKEARTERRNSPMPIPRTQIMWGFLRRSYRWIR